MFTQRAVLLGVVALCFYLVAVVNALPGFYYVLVWLAVGLLAASLGIALLSLTGTHCRLRAGRAFGYADWPQIGRSAEEGFNRRVSEAPPSWEVELDNSGTLNKTALVLEVRCVPVSPRPDERKRVLIGRFLIEALPSGGHLESPIRLGFLPRGRYCLNSARLVGSDVLGLFRIARRVALPDTPLETIVGPPVVALGAVRSATLGAGGLDGPRTRAQLGAGGDLRGVRPYVPGDDWRHVHWATTARTGTLAVREFEHTGRSTVLVVWDGAAGAAVESGGRSTTEDALCLCASLLLAVDATQAPIALAALGAESQWTQGEGEVGVLPRAMVESLADARAERTGSLTDELFRVASRGGFGHVFFVSSSLRADLVDAARECGLRREAVSVALLDGAAYLSSFGRGLGKNAAVAVEGGRTLPLSSASYDAQEQALKAAGARVVRVAPQGREGPWQTLESALLALVD